MNHMERREAMRGACIAVIGGIFWGLAGVFGQYLFTYRGLNARWLVSVRLVLAGLLLLFTVSLKQRSDMWRIWKKKKDVFWLFLFAVFGMAGCQLTYYSSVELSNAGTATVLQYTAPAMIMLYVAVRAGKMPGFVEIGALILALAGTFILATHGHIHSLAISKAALIWGLSSAVMMAVYNLLPLRLMKEYGTFCVIGWGMLIGGILMCIFVKPWHIIGTWDIKAVGAMAMVVVVGTVLSFSFYMEGVRIIGASRASLFASVEPVTATAATVLMMHAPFTAEDLLGIICIMAAVLLLSIKK